MKKIAFLSAIGLIFFIGFLSFSSQAQASNSCTPTVTVKDTGETTAKLKITCTELKSTKVSIKILVENKDTNTDSYKKATATLGKKGSVTLKISGLDSATSYSFKVKVKKSSSNSYSAFSSSVDTTTKGADYNPEIDKINGITDNSVKLNISCDDDLENENVSVLVAHKKKTTWSTKTFTLKLDDDGEGSVTLDGLKSDTLYSFKIKIKKDGDRSYSNYSSVKTATTDED